jgi:hypothetical protein
MLVNASQHPGPALWQGIMLLILAAWAVYILCPPIPSPKAVRLSALGIAIFGVVLMVVIVKAGV